MNGEVIWQGESAGDVGTIIVKNNEITLKPFKKKGFTGQKI